MWCIEAGWGTKYEPSGLNAASVIGMKNFVRLGFPKYAVLSNWPNCFPLDTKLFVWIVAAPNFLVYETDPLIDSNDEPKFVASESL